MLVKNEVAELKIVVGASMPLPAGAKGRNGCSAKTTKPNTNSTVLNSSSETAYCFQFCGPVSRRDSIHSQPARRPITAVGDPGEIKAARESTGGRVVTTIREARSTSTSSIQGVLASKPFADAEGPPADRRTTAGSPAAVEARSIGCVLRTRSCLRRPEMHARESLRSR